MTKFESKRYFSNYYRLSKHYDAFGIIKNKLDIIYDKIVNNTTDIFNVNVCELTTLAITEIRMQKFNILTELRNKIQLKTIEDFQNEQHTIHSRLGN